MFAALVHRTCPRRGFVPERRTLSWRGSLTPKEWYVSSTSLLPAFRLDRCPSLNYLRRMRRITIYLTLCFILTASSFAQTNAAPDDSGGIVLTQDALSSRMYLSPTAYIPE